MSGWTQQVGQAACLAENNIDTDQLIPARFMVQPRSEGYGNFLFNDHRQLPSGEQDPNFVLNRFPKTSVLIAGHNFGMGSSREAAVYALVDAGITVVVASGFADIFAANAINNGLLPALISDDDLEQLHQTLGNKALNASINLEAQQLTIGELVIPFTLESNAKAKLINGWDDIDLTLNHRDTIVAFKQKRVEQHAWATPNEDASS